MGLFCRFALRPPISEGRVGETCKPAHRGEDVREIEYFPPNWIAMT
jgi:hypothetical protein